MARRLPAPAPVAQTSGATPITKERAVIWKHAMKNGLLPVITSMGNTLGIMMGGSIVMESLFSLPGLGTLTITALNMRDTPTVVATAVVFAIIYNVILLMVDILYAFIDPKIKAKYTK